MAASFENFWCVELLNSDGNTDGDGNALYPPGAPFGGFAGDLSLLTFGNWGNCYEDNVFTSFYSPLGVLPPCP